MCNFNTLDEAAKTAYHNELIRWAEAFGGKNFFLQLLEAIRAAKPHPLTAKNCEFRFEKGTITWTKPIFKEKLSLLLKERIQESERGNLLPPADAKNYKEVLNLVRMLNPIIFEVKSQSGERFTIRPFDVTDTSKTLLNPLFDALFFCAIETVKKVLNYEPKAS